MAFTAYPQSTPDSTDFNDGTGPRAAGQFETWNHGYAGEQKLTSWPMRLASGAIDYLPLIVIFDLMSSAHLVTLGWLFMAAAIGFNSIYMQGTTGQSLGKRLVGTRLVMLANTGPMTFMFCYPGVGRCFGRQFAHFFDSLALYLGYVRPAWQRYHQTWADSMAKTVVIPANSDALVVPRPEGARSIL